MATQLILAAPQYHTGGAGREIAAATDLYSEFRTDRIAILSSSHFLRKRPAA